MMNLQGWYPLALSEGVAAGTSAGVVLLEQEIVVWRDSAGKAHAWEDRCPHRGMKLSFGFVRGDHIACLYHGWEYAADGQCRLIPAHPKLEVPKTICARTYPAAESGGMIWAGFGETGEPPSLPEATGVRSLYVDQGIEAVLAALPVAFGATALNGSAPLVTLDTPHGPLGIGLHQIDAAHTALHITVAGSATPETLATIARAATRLRDTLETGVAA